MMLAMLTKCPELMISEDEAKRLALALTNVMAHYKINIAPKTVAMMQFAAAAASIYGPKTVMILKRKNAEKKAAEDNTFENGITPGAM